MPVQRKKKRSADDDGWESRSERKRASTALQDLAEELTRLAPGLWQDLPLAPDLLEALHVWRRTGSREARRRQLQYLGRLMREADSAAIASGLAALRTGQTRESALLQHTERLREELIRADANEREKLLARWPDARRELDGLLGAIRADNGSPARAAYRALFRRLYALQAVTP